MSGIASIADVLAVEREHDGLLPNSTYEMIGAAARTHPDAPALSFFLRAEDHAQPQVWTYETLFSRITATANFLHELGVGRDDVVAFALPNLPQTHLAMWGGQAAGIAFAINPMLEPAAIAELLDAGEVKVLITSAPVPGMDLWSKLQPMLGRVRSLRHETTCVHMLAYRTDGRRARCIVQQVELNGLRLGPWHAHEPSCRCRVMRGSPRQRRHRSLAMYRDVSSAPAASQHVAAMSRTVSTFCSPCAKARSGRTVTGLDLKLPQAQPGQRCASGASIPIDWPGWNPLTGSHSMRSAQAPGRFA